MMKKKTVRLISGAVAGILVGAMLVSVVASGIVYAGAASSSELKDKLSSLEDQKAEIKKELDSTANKVSDVEKTRAALQKEITLTKEEIETVKAYIERLQQQIDVKSTELESAQKALEAKEENFSQTVRTTYEQGDISYLEVLLNSSSFSDLLNRLDIVSTIMDDNKKIVAEDIRSCGLFRTKARDLHACAVMLLAEYGGRVPDTMEELLRLPGVGRKTANLILGDIFGKPAIVCDTHCIRLSNRLGFVRDEKDPVKVEKALRGLVTPAESSDFCHRLVLFGREHCTARAPRCTDCPLADICPSFGKMR